MKTESSRRGWGLLMAIAVVALWSGRAPAQEFCRADDFTVPWPSWLEGWTPVDPDQVALTWESSGGNPGGFMVATDLNPGNAIFRAPAVWGGDLSFLDDVGVIRLDHKFIFDPNGFPISSAPAVSLHGPGGSASYQWPGLPVQGVWQAYEVPLSEGFWTVSSGTWSGLLAQVDEIVFSLEITNGHDYSGMDNAYIGIPPLPEEDLDGNGIPDDCPVGRQDCTVCCPTTVSSFPYIEDFESQMPCAEDCSNPCPLSGGWFNEDTGDDMDWLVDEGGTPTTGTGPDLDHNPGTPWGNYLYVEATGCPNQQAVLYSPCFDLAGLERPELNFWYHRAGDSMGDLTLEISDDCCANWIQIWNTSGNYGDVWMRAIVDLGAFAGTSVRLRFTGATLGLDQGDMAIDDILIRDLPCCPTIVSTFPYIEDFESQALCLETCGTACPLSGGWYNDDSVDAVDWLVDQDGTPTEGTGPDVDHNPGIPGGNYLYVEATDCPGQLAILYSPCFDLSGSEYPEIHFWYHMQGGDTELLAVEISNDGCGYWGPLWTRWGDKGPEWLEAVVSLSAYRNTTVRLRFIARTGVGGLSDMAIDDLLIHDPGGRYPATVLAEPWDSRGFVFVAPGDQSPVDEVQITVLDQWGDLYDGAHVQVEFSADCDSLCVDPVGAGLEGDAWGGHLTLNPRVGGAESCAVSILVDGVPLKTYDRIVGLDFDGRGPNGQVDGADVKFFQILDVTEDLRGDYNGDTVVDYGDGSILDQALGTAANSEPCHRMAPNCARMTNFAHDGHRWTSTDPVGLALQWEPAGGQPDGWLRATDLDGGISGVAVASPPEWAGDVYELTSFGQLRFDLWLPEGTIPQVGPTVTLVGNAGQATYALPGLPTPGIWNGYSVALDAGLWNTGAYGSPLLLVDILADLQQVRIRADYTSGSDACGFDNVFMGLVPEPGEDADGNGLPDPCQAENFSVAIPRWDNPLGIVYVEPGSHGAPGGTAVQVNDGYGAPRPNSVVEAQFGQDCTHLCIDPVQPNMKVLTDYSGGTGLDPAAGGCGDCTVTVTLDQILRRTYSRVVSSDWDGMVADGWVNHRDWYFFSQHFGSPYEHCADLSPDGVIDLSDYAVMAAAMGAYNTELCGGGDPTICNHTSCFHFGAEGWTGTSGAISFFLTTGGNPDGFLNTLTFGEEAEYALAPGPFLGNLTAFDGQGYLRFDHKLISTGGAPPQWPMKVRMWGSGGSAEYTFPELPIVGAWTRYVAPLDGSLWTVTEGTWNGLLASVVTLGLSAQFTDGYETCGYDNVVLGLPMDYYADGNRNLIPDACEMVPTPVPLPEIGDRKELSLRNSPNPFNPATVIAYDLPAPCRVDLRVFDLRGRLVRVLVDGEARPAGPWEVTWGGVDQADRPVAAGVYLARMQAGDQVAVLRMAMIK